MKRVLIVTESRGSSLASSDYLEMAETYQRVLQRAKELVEVTIVATAREAKEAALAAPVNKKINAVVFLSRGMYPEAEWLAANRPGTRVIIFTGLIPGGKVIWANKAWSAGSETIQNIVLHY